MNTAKTIYAAIAGSFAVWQLWVCYPFVSKAVSTLIPPARFFQPYATFFMAWALLLGIPAVVILWGVGGRLYRRYRPAAAQQHQKR